MKKMDKVIIAFKGVVATLGTVATYLLGDWDTALMVLAIFVVLDYVTGVLVAVVNKTLDSGIGFKGLAKKSLIIVILIMAVCLDRLLGNEGWLFRTLVCYFYIANEGISLLENAGNLGLPVPKKIKDVLEQLNKGEQ